MYSLSARLLLSVTALLLVFFGITIFVLELTFRDSAEQAIEDRLYVQLIVLLAGAEPSADGASLTISQSLPEARFETPGSGLYGLIQDSDARRLWRSPSSVGTTLPRMEPLAPGALRFERVRTGEGEALFALSIGVEWEFEDGRLERFVFAAAEDLAPYLVQVSRFRRQLLGWFAALTVLLIAGQAVLVRGMLRPLRRVEDEIVEVEQGQRAVLGDDYPRELQGVTSNLNGLLGAERERLARYRDTLGNLAHSLKTPLAVIRTAVEVRRAGVPAAGPRAADPEGGETPGEAGGAGALEGAELVAEQVERMQEIVAYQLQRAAAWGATSLGQAPEPVAPIIDQLVRSLEKVYAERGLRLHADVEPEACFYGEAGDLMEVLGNLMDNACKWARSEVHVEARAVSAPGSRRDGLVLSVLDDGPGIDEEDASRLTERGVRADEQVAGHGIGLNIVREVIGLYDGRMRIGRNDGGGACITIEFPAR